MEAILPVITSGTGKGAQAAIGIGIGAWGDLFGADIHGKVYGTYTEGGNYALFANGDVYRNKLDIHLQENGTIPNRAVHERFDRRNHSNLRYSHNFEWHRFSCLR
jgi:hypothetical protein